METLLRTATSSKDRLLQVPMVVAVETLPLMETNSKDQLLQLPMAVATATSRAMEILAHMGNSRVQLQLVLTVAMEALLHMDSNRDLLALMGNSKEAVLLVLMVAMEIQLHTVNSSKEEMLVVALEMVLHMANSSLDSLLLVLTAAMGTLALMDNSRDPLVHMATNKHPLHRLAMANSNRVRNLPVEASMETPQTIHQQPAM